MVVVVNNSIIIIFIILINKVSYKLLGRSFSYLPSGAHLTFQTVPWITTFSILIYSAQEAKNQSCLLKIDGNHISAKIIIKSLYFHNLPPSGFYYQSISLFLSYPGIWQESNSSSAPIQPCDYPWANNSKAFQVSVSLAVKLMQGLDSLRGLNQLSDYMIQYYLLTTVSQTTPVQPECLSKPV